MIIALLTLAQLSFGHGEHKPGPHAGFVKMPGAFHTEIVPHGSIQFDIYLLDINFTKPIIKDSKVDITLVDGSQKFPIKCKPSENRFACDLPKGPTLVQGELHVKAVRDSKKGAEVIYKLPLSLTEAP